MTEEAAWFADADPTDPASGRRAIETGQAEEPADWPALAVDAGFATDEGDYYDRLHEATVAAAAAGARERERAEDKQLIHALRAMDDCRRTANELAERVAEWGGSVSDEASSGVEYARSLADHDPETPLQRRLFELACRVVEVDEEATELRRFVERTAPSVAPNLAAMAGPVLAARLVSEAGGLGALAKLPSGTVQVLGAEDALFAHLQGGAPSPKHGVIFTHEYVRGTASEHRGSAARALAGKLTIAARVDHYGGDRQPSLDRELDERIARIRERESE